MFSLIGGRSHYKQNSAEFSVEFQVLENCINLKCLIGWVGIPFFKRAKVLDALRVLGWILGNWDSIKDTRRLSHVDPPGRGMTR